MNNQNWDIKYHVIVSADIGGDDPDDFQSMVHVYNEHPDLWFIENNSTFRGIPPALNRKAGEGVSKELTTDPAAERIYSNPNTQKTINQELRV